MIGPDIPAHLLAQPSSSAAEDDTSDNEAGPAPPIGPQIPIGPQVPPTVSAATKGPPALVEDEDDDDEDYAPALPPHLAAARDATARRVVGPTLPTAAPRYADDSDDDDVGPQPLPAGVVLEEKDGVQEFMEREERRRKQLEVRVGLAFNTPGPSATGCIWRARPPRYVSDGVPVLQARTKTTSD